MLNQVQPEDLEADLAAFLRVCGTGSVANRRKQAQEFADRLDAVRDSARLLYYARFSDHISRL